MKTRPKHVKMTKAKMIRLGYRKGPVSTQVLAAIAITLPSSFQDGFGSVPNSLPIENMRVVEQWFNGVFK